MLGFGLHRSIQDGGYDVTGTVRSELFPSHPACAGLKYLTGIDVSDFHKVEAVLDVISPDILINAAGIKHTSGNSDNLRMFEVNAGFPRKLTHAASQRDIKLVQISTDAVFDGVEGGYDELSPPNPSGPYALSKLLGESYGHGMLTIRTSIIGRALDKGDGLMDWLLAQRGSTVRGYSKSIFSGLPVDEIARFLLTRVLAAPSHPEGVYHLAAEPIDKHTLINMILRQWGVGDITLERTEGVPVNRSLKTRRAAEFANYRAHPWPTLIANTHSFYSKLGLA
jgi:dTDP-4-dehydrorhamnose reductase